MTMPKAYKPKENYQFQILRRNQDYSHEWEHCDYVKDQKERNLSLNEYSLAYGWGWEFKAIMLPERYWPKMKLGRAV